jgi:hypothetical protein
MSDPVEIQVQEMTERIPGVLAKARSPMSIRQLAGALDHYTNEPWSVVFAVRQLEADGVVRRDTTRGNRAPWRWVIADEAAPGGLVTEGR